MLIFIYEQGGVGYIGDNHFTVFAFINARGYFRGGLHLAAHKEQEGC